MNLTLCLISMKRIALILNLFCLIGLFLTNQCFSSNPYQEKIDKLNNWLLINRDQVTCLPHSHVGDERFVNWAITYDSAVTALAYIAQGNTADAKRIIDFYIETPNVWRLGGIIEAVNPTNPALGEDWSVRSGSNLWMGIAGFYLYKATGENKYLDFTKKIAEFAGSLQDKDRKSFSFGGIRLGPLGGENVASDQHLNYDINQPSFYEIFATEHNIDAYVLFSLLYEETKQAYYKQTKEEILGWLKRLSYNKKEHRLNRGYRDGSGIDTAVATDVFSWGISALGVDILDTFEPGFAQNLIGFIENNCICEVSYIKSSEQEKKVFIKGVDFVDQATASSLGRKPIVSIEWTFQLINAYARLESDFNIRHDKKKAVVFGRKRNELIKSILSLAVGTDNTLAFPYATEANAAIGHEYKTPAQNNLSAIGVAYGILVLSGFDPLVVREK